jgi:hypothetical protein
VDEDGAGREDAAGLVHVREIDKNRGRSGLCGWYGGGMPPPITPTAPAAPVV